MTIVAFVAGLLLLILAAARHDALPGFGAVMLYFVLPITALTLVVLSRQERRRTHRA
jgi:cation:H+ antiporter